MGCNGIEWNGMRQAKIKQNRMGNNVIEWNRKG